MIELNVGIVEKVVVQLSQGNAGPLTFTKPPYALRGKSMGISIIGLFAVYN
jgi:hypothetical protein